MGENKKLRTIGSLNTNLRERADKESNSIIRLVPGTEVEMLDIEHRAPFVWIRVKTQGGIEGYIIKDFLEEVN